MLHGNVIQCRFYYYIHGTALYFRDPTAYLHVKRDRFTSRDAGTGQVLGKARTGPKFDTSQLDLSVSTFAMIFGRLTWQKSIPASLLYV